MGEARPGIDLRPAIRGIRPRSYAPGLRTRLVNSLARPGGNTTGVSILAAELDGKRQEILIEAVPGLRRMAAIVDSSTTGSTQLQALQDAARARNVELSIYRIASAKEIRQPSTRRRRRVPER